MKPFYLLLQDNIEYYLGKVRLPNLHWKPGIPSAWEIPARKEIYGWHTEAMSGMVRKDHNDESIEYRLNKLGYRSNIEYEDLDDKNLIISLGCSDAFGMMVNYENTYIGILEKMLPEYTFINLSVCGASADSITRIGVNTLAEYQVDHVLTLWPLPSLREFVSKTFKSGVHTLDNKDVPYTDWWNHIDWVSNNYNYNKNRDYLYTSSLLGGAEFHDLMIDRNDKYIIQDLISFHEYTSIGIDTHAALANYFYKRITGQKSLFENTQP
jgi:hypothetical protein